MSYTSYEHLKPFVPFVDDRGVLNLPRLISFCIAKGGTLWAKPYLYDKVADVTLNMRRRIRVDKDANEMIELLDSGVTFVCGTPKWDNNAN